MRDLGITGAVRGKKGITTIPGGSVERAPTSWTASSSRRHRTAAGSPTSPTSRPGPESATSPSLSTRSPPDSGLARIAFQGVPTRPGRPGDGAMAARSRRRRPPRPEELVHHSDAGSQYTSFPLAEHLDAAEIAASIGSVGDAYNALTESTIGLFKTELIKPGRPWKPTAFAPRPATVDLERAGRARPVLRMPRPASAAVSPRWYAGQRLPVRRVPGTPGPLLPSQASAKTWWRRAGYRRRRWGPLSPGRRGGVSGWSDPPHHPLCRVRAEERASLRRLRRSWPWTQGKGQLERGTAAPHPAGDGVATPHDEPERGRGAMR